jgi:hypothetical protein
VRVTVFLSFVPFPILEPRIKDSRANNLQAEINSQGQRNRLSLSFAGNRVGAIARSMVRRSMPRKGACLTRLRETTERTLNRSRTSND